MSNLNQHHLRQGIPSSTNWESAMLLSLVQTVDEIISESRACGELPARHCSSARKVIQRK
jgi:hypothetical protein